MNKINLLKNQNGSMLILVVFFLVTLSLLAFSAGYAARQKLQAVSRLEAREQMRLSADAAARKASAYVAERINVSDSAFHALNQDWANSESWKNVSVGKTTCSIRASDGEPAAYGLVDEDRKINLNTAQPQALQALFQISADVEREEARRIVAAIRDWIDADEDLNDGGAESKVYAQSKPPYRSKNAPFSRFEELLWVKGMSPGILARVEPYLTLDAKKVNLNTAAEPVLLAMGLDSVLVPKIILFRNGKDGKPGTADDGVFTNLNEVPDVLGRYIYLNDADKKSLSALFSSGFAVNSTVFRARIFVTLKHQKQMMKVDSIIDPKGGMRRWYEEFF